MDSIKSIIVTTGDQGDLTEKIDDFFTETRNYMVERFAYKMPDYFNIKSGSISSGEKVTDDRVTYMLYNERLVACVIQTRTETNNIQYTFYRNNQDIDDLVTMVNEMRRD